MEIKTMTTTINNQSVKMYAITVTNLHNNETESFADRYNDKRDALHTAISWGWSLNAPYEYTVDAWLADNSVVNVYSGYNLNR